jgi:hypothetical protein
MAFPCTVAANAHYMTDLQKWLKPKVFDVLDPAVDPVLSKKRKVSWTRCCVRVATSKVYT